MNRPPCHGTTAKQSPRYRNHECMNCHYILDCITKEKRMDKNIEVGTKLDKGKPRWSLVPTGVMRDIVAVLEFGAVKYAVNNWMKVENPGTRYYDAAMRHIDARADGEKMDPDSGLPHLAHAIASLMFLMWFESKGKC